MCDEITDDMTEALILDLIEEVKALRSLPDRLTKFSNDAGYRISVVELRRLMAAIPTNIPGGS